MMRLFEGCVARMYFTRIVRINGIRKSNVVLYVLYVGARICISLVSFLFSD